MSNRTTGHPKMMLYLFNITEPIGMLESLQLLENNIDVFSQAGVFRFDS